tara:strand:- start:11 stop:745 length:735 start_codon:yes stop_codon:yes gene_type:complete
MKFLVFHNAADDSYINTVENFRGAYAATQTVDVYFESPISGSMGANAYDKITLACTNGEEDRAVEELAAAMTKNASVITIADDVNSVYACQNITSVTTISTATSASTKRLITFAADKTLTAADSGAWVYMSDAGTEKELILPAAAAGLEFHVFIHTAQTGDTAISIPGGYFIGGFDMSDPTTAGDSNFFQSDGNSNDYINLDSDAKGRLQGGYMQFVCDGTNWHVQGHLVGDGTLATPFADSES